MIPLRYQFRNVDATAAMASQLGATGYDFAQRNSGNDFADVALAASDTFRENFPGAGIPSTARNYLGAAVALGKHYFGEKLPTIGPNSNVKWMLASKELQDDLVIVSQYEPQNVTLSGQTADFAELKMFGRTQPHLHYTGGSTRTISFDTQFVNPVGFTKAGVEPPAGINALYETKDKLLSCMEPGPTLGRPRKFLFVWGDTVSDVYVQSVSCRIGQRWASGMLRSLDFSITLLVIPPDDGLEVPFEFEKPCVAKPYTVAKGDVSYEVIANSQYNDPAYGPSLLKANSGKPLLPGTVIILPCAKDLTKEEKKPETKPTKKSSPNKPKTVQNVCLLRSNEVSLDSSTVVTKKGYSISVEPPQSQAPNQSLDQTLEKPWYVP